MLTLYSHLCILKLPNRLLKVSRTLFKGDLIFCAAEERNAGERHFSDLHYARTYFLVCACKLIFFFFFGRRSNTQNSSLPCAQGVQQCTVLAKKDSYERCRREEFAFNAFTPAVSELGNCSSRRLMPKCQPLSGCPGMKPQVSPSGAPSRCFPPPRAVEGDVGMPFGSRFDAAGFFFAT